MQQKVKNCELDIVQGDITTLEVDAIVNAANNVGQMGGGVAAAILRRGGDIIEQEALKKGPIEIGAAVATTAGTLKVKYVIHAATMGMDFKTDEYKIRSACASALKLADDLKLTSIAFPALGCGVGGFAVSACARIMAQEYIKFAKLNIHSTLKKVIFCLFNDGMYQDFFQIVNGYVSHFRDTLGDGPYVTVDIIIEMDGGVVLIERSNPPLGFALQGGFVDYGETLETAARREAKEETNLELEDLKQFHVYSDPRRDPRFHTVTLVFIAQGKGRAQSGDDAKALRIVPFADLLTYEYAFDHKDVIRDYLKSKK